MTSGRGGGRSGSLRGYAPWLVIDVVLITVFALAGHLSHYGSLSPAGVGRTALPFLLAYLATTAILRSRRRPMAWVGTALALWGGTTVGGLLLRVLLGESAALSFQIVALMVLGIFLLLPRAAAALAARQARRRQVPLPVPQPSPGNSQGAAT